MNARALVVVAGVALAGLVASRLGPVQEVVADATGDTAVGGTSDPTENYQGDDWDDVLDRAERNEEMADDYPPSSAGVDL